MAKIVLLTNGRGKFSPVTESSFKNNEAKFKAEQMRPATEAEIADYEGVSAPETAAKAKKEAKKAPESEPAEAKEPKSKGAK